MDGLAQELEPQEIVLTFVYTHEVHSGGYYPHHTSFEQKMAHAQAFREIFHVNRPILVDGLDGVCHRAYDSMPNMTWIIDWGGCPVYKAEWTYAESVGSAYPRPVDYAEALGKQSSSLLALQGGATGLPTY